MKPVTFGILCFVFLSGCLVTSNSKTTTSGNYVPEQTFERIEAGKTTASWVQATLGEPTCKTKVDGTASEIWKWNYTETKNGSGTVLFLFAGSSKDEKTRAAYVEIKDGVVTKKWRA
jgi:outer membrane protein assembly factor BamE (lipoprotein component of BamABCDE complex)